MLTQGVARKDLLWALAAMCQLYRVPFDARLMAAELPPPHTMTSLLAGANALGFRAALTPARDETLPRIAAPAIIALREVDAAAASPAPVRTDGVVTPLQSPESPTPPPARLALLLRVTDEEVLYATRDSGEPISATRAAFAARLVDVAMPFQIADRPVEDPDTPAPGARFGFRWFVPELLKHRSIWRDVVFASLAIQVLGLAVPLFTQTIIDKVVVHQTVNTLAVLASALAAVMLFSAGMTWIRQYLVLHTGNRVDAVLASRVFERLLALPPRYFEARPTGALVARLHGVETIREFVSGAAVTLLLDLPFLGVFLAIMFFYSWPLTLIALGILALVVLISLGVVPMIRARLNQQFLLGARNQSFLTEYVAGMATVKALQMEPQLKARYGEYLSSYLGATFETRRLSNTYGTVSNLLEQLMTLAILAVGAWLVMQNTGFTIGMLVAFQMFAGRMSQPMMRLVGLWQEFQQAAIAVRRLGDVMDAPVEPYSLIPRSAPSDQASIEIEQLAFRYGETRPYLYEGFDLSIPAGATVALMGPSGSGKSTLAKLLLGFYQPSAGAIRINDRDIRHLSANELRGMFGVVPQETLLFAGTIYDNLILANPDATFPQIVHACRIAGIHETIDRLPEAYQTPIGEHGVGLSGGQRQRLAIARALLKRPKILIFDEATANLDQDTAEAFGRTVSQLKGRVTMLFITHRLPSTLAVDAVVRLGEETRQRVQVGG